LQRLPFFRTLAANLILLAVCACAGAQTPDPAAAGEPALKIRPEAKSQAGVYRIDAGTHILLSMVNAVSTKQAQVGDRLYLETSFPVMSGDRIVIPQGSWVTGTVTSVRRGHALKGKGELRVQFDSLTLPNGVSRNLHSDIGNKAPGDDGPRPERTTAGTVVETTVGGAGIGSAIGAATGRVGTGAAVGAAAGLGAGLVAVLLTRDRDERLPKGATVELVLDHAVEYSDVELNFANAGPARGLPGLR
jgi:type IV secretion system protein VirB10